MTPGQTFSHPFIITSPQNPRIKNLIRLMSEGRERRLTHSFALEGAREITRALQSGLRPLASYHCPELLGHDARTALLLMENLTKEEKTHEPFFHEITPAIFQKIVLRSDKDGLLVVFEAPAPRRLAEFLQDTQVANAPPQLFLALQGVEKPGNIGAIVRSADAFGVDGIVIVTATSGEMVDLYHPHLVRNSLGAVFSQRFLTLSSDDLVSFCETHGLALVGAALHDQARNFYEVNFSRPMVLLMGSEATGIDHSLQSRCHRLIQIPMRGLCDSLNVSTATAVLLSEISRQRQVLSRNTW